MKNNRITPNAQITDVAQFFAAITEEYEYFERNVLQIIDKIPTCSPQEIEAQCTMIGEQRNKLAIMDEQMFAIIDLAGNEIAQTPMIQTYRVAFARATMACNNLYQKLQALRATM